MGTTQVLRLPSEPFRLEEANLPPDMAQTLAGQSVQVTVLPEENSPVQFGAYVPLRTLFTDRSGKLWRLPRRWLVDARTSEPPIDPYYPVRHKMEFVEELTLPTVWDLLDINMAPEGFVNSRALTPRHVHVALAPEEPLKVVLRARLNAKVVSWRIPHDWRKRRILLPRSAVLIASPKRLCASTTIPVRFAAHWSSTGFEMRTDGPGPSTSGIAFCSALETCGSPGHEWGKA